jgi:hypothetical protein
MLCNQRVERFKWLQIMTYLLPSEFYIERTILPNREKLIFSKVPAGDLRNSKSNSAWAAIKLWPKTITSHVRVCSNGTGNRTSLHYDILKEINCSIKIFLLFSFRAVHCNKKVDKRSGENVNKIIKGRHVITKEFLKHFVMVKQRLREKGIVKIVKFKCLHGWY